MYAFSTNYMHTELCKGIGYLPFSYLWFQSSLDPKGVGGESYPLGYIYKLLRDRGLALVFPIVSCTAHYMRSDLHEILITNNERTDAE